MYTVACLLDSDGWLTASTPSPTTPSARTTPSGWSRLCTPARCRSPRWWRRPSPAPRRSTPELNAIAYRDYDRARVEARDPRPGFFAGVPTWVKDNSQSPGCPPRGHRRLGRPAGDRRRRVRADVPRHGRDPARQEPALGVRLPPDVRAPPPRSGPLSLGPRRTRPAPRRPAPPRWSRPASSRSRTPTTAAARSGSPPQSTGWSASSRPAAGSPQTGIATSSRSGSSPDGVVTRSVRDTAALMREAERIYRALHLPPLGDLTRPTKARLRIAVQTGALGRRPPRGHRADPEDRGAPRVAGAPRRGGGAAGRAHLPRRLPPLLGMLALFLSRNGRRLHGPTWNGEHLDAFTLGLARHAARRLHKVPLAIARLRGARRAAERFYASYDVHLSPTLASRDAGDRSPRPDAGLRHGPGPAAGLDGVHAVSERHRSAGDLAAARDHRRRAAAGDDVQRRGGSRGAPDRAGLRARGGSPFASIQA